MLNRCEFIGNLGADPDVRSTSGGEKVANLRLAVTERWKDQSGERKEKTTWVPVVVWGKTAEVAEKYLRKGSKVYIAGAFEVRKWTDKDGHDKYSTEVVVRGFKGELTMLDGRGGEGGEARERAAPAAADRQSREAPKGGGGNDLDDEVPF